MKLEDLDDPKLLKTYIKILQEYCAGVARDHGWHPAPGESVNIGEKLALIHSEVSEALEEYRNEHHIKEAGFELVELRFETDDGGMWGEQFTETELAAGTNNGKLAKPCGFGSELADVVIRCFDLAGIMGIDLATAILEKMRYNETRPFRHGGKAA
jgi:NTP pyrophosphatase (non-canonical NTP hydrolase)